MILTFFALLFSVAVCARLEEKLHDAFSDPNWMVFEDREDEKNYQEE